MEERKHVMLDRAVLGLKAFAATEKMHYALNGVHLTSRFAEATDGKMLLRVPHANFDAEGFPEVNDHSVGLNGEDFIVQPSAFEKAFAGAAKKTSRAVLQYVRAGVTEDGEKPVLSATNLEDSVSIRTRPVEGEFPHSDTLIPDPEGALARVTLAADRLAEFCTFANRYGDNDGGTRTITLELYGPDRAVRIPVPLAPGREAIGVLMPIVGPADKHRAATKIEALEETVETGALLLKDCQAEGLKFRAALKAIGKASKSAQVQALVKDAIG